MLQVVIDRFGGPEVLSLVDRPTPKPGLGEVLIECEAAGVNFADTMIRRGEYLKDQPRSMSPGCEAVGRIMQTGDGTDAQVGTRVAAFVEAGGAYATHVVAPSHRVYAVPEDLPAELITAVFLQGVTAYYALHRFGMITPGKTILVHAAAGGVGGLATQLAVSSGCRVIATASTPAKRAVALLYGADVILDSRSVDELADSVLDATDGRGCDLVVDGVGGPLFTPSLKSLAIHGRYVVVGSASQQPGMLDTRHLLVRNQTVVGFILAHIADSDANEPGDTLRLLCDMVRDHSLIPSVVTLPLSQAADAHRLLEGRENAGKVVLVP